MTWKFCRVNVSSTTPDYGIHNSQWGGISSHPSSIISPFCRGGILKDFATSDLCEFRPFTCMHSFHIFLYLTVCILTLLALGTKFTCLFYLSAFKNNLDWNQNCSVLLLFYLMKIRQSCFTVFFRNNVIERAVIYRGVHSLCSIHSGSFFSSIFPRFYRWARWYGHSFKYIAPI